MSSPDARESARIVRRARHVVLLLLVAASCGRFRNEDPMATDQATIVFVNQSLAQADVYAIGSGGGEAVRLGVVLPGSTSALRVRSDLLHRSPLNIVARLLAESTSPQSGPVSLVAGDRVQITLPSNGRTLQVLPAS
jgi:hypothetical protein